MSRRNNTDTPADPAGELAVLQIERDRLSKERLFREVAVANLEAIVARAHVELDRIWPAMMFLDTPQAAMMQNGDLMRLFVVTSDEWRQQQLERIAGDPRPGHPGAQWSTLTKAQTADRLVEIDARVVVLEHELAKEAARQLAATAQAELEALEAAGPAPVQIDAETVASA